MMKSYCLNRTMYHQSSLFLNNTNISINKKCKGKLIKIITLNSLYFYIFFWGYLNLCAVACTLIWILIGKSMFFTCISAARTLWNFFRYQSVSFFFFLGIRSNSNKNDHFTISNIWFLFHDYNVLQSL